MAKRIWTDAELTPIPTEYLFNVVDSRVISTSRVLYDYANELVYGDGESESSRRKVGETESGDYVNAAIRRSFYYESDDESIDVQVTLDRADAKRAPGLVCLSVDGSDIFVRVANLAEAEKIVKRIVEAEDRAGEVEKVKAEFPRAEGY